MSDQATVKAQIENDELDAKEVQQKYVGPHATTAEEDAYVAGWNLGMGAEGAKEKEALSLNSFEGKLFDAGKTSAERIKAL